MRIVDLSATIGPSPETTPASVRTDLAYTDHRAGAQQIRSLFGVPPELLRDGEGWAIETFTRFGTHDSTHVDAPWHYNSAIGAPGRRRSTSCRWTSSFMTASCSICATRPRATR